MSVVNVLSEWLKTESERLNKSYAVLRKQFDNKNKPLVNRWKKFLKTQSFSTGIIKGKGGGQSAPVAPEPQEIPSLEGELAKMEYEKRREYIRKQIEAYVKAEEERKSKETQERLRKQQESYKGSPFSGSGIRGGANGDDDEGQTDTEDNSDDEEQNLALPHFWNGQQWVPIPLPPPIPEDQLLQGDDIIEGEGLGLRIARKIYDWYKPPIDFEEWRARQQDRFASDAEAEAALEEAKASRVLREAETALNKLKVDTAEYKKKLLAIRNEKVRLAREIGVWIGDDRNPVDWDSARAETARREAERERIQREEPDYDVVGEGLKAMNRTIHYLKEKRGMRRPPLDLNNPDYISYKKLRDGRDMVKSYLKSGR
jgi:hypothetical protein